MYYRNRDHFDVERLARALQAMPDSPPSSEVGKFFMVMGLIAAPIFAFFLILCSGL